MPKNIAIINSYSRPSRSLFDLLEELSGDDYSFCLLADSSRLAERFRENGWKIGKARFGPRLNGKFKRAAFVFLLPFLFLSALAKLARRKFREKIAAIVCLGANEKIIFTPVAALLKIKTVWLEDSLPDFFEESSGRGFLSFVYRLCSRGASLVVFGDFAKSELAAAGLKEENIKAVRPGIKLGVCRRQDNLFNELASVGGARYKRRFFTVGVIAKLDKKQNAEALFRAVKICLGVIPGVQLIVVGEGKERKNLAWLAQKMEIDGVVWFVGEQKHLKKWLDGFDIFVPLSEPSEWEDFTVALRAMAAGLPIVNWRESIPEPSVDFFSFSPSRPASVDADALAEQIIKLYKDKNLRFELGKRNKESVEKHFTIDKTAEGFKKIL